MADLRIKDLPNATTFTGKRLPLDSTADGTESATIEALLGDPTTLTAFDQDRAIEYGVTLTLDASSNWTDSFIFRIPAFLNGLLCTGAFDVRTDAGTVTLLLENNGTTMTGAGAIACTTTEQDVTITANHTMTTGNYLQYTLTSRSGCNQLMLRLVFARP